MSDWDEARVCDVCEQVPVGRKYSKELVQEHGSTKVIDQSQEGIFGWHDNAADIHASPESPVFTFANHTCSMRWMDEPFSVIQNVFPMRGIPGKTDTRFLYYASGASVVQDGYKGHFPQFRESIIQIPPLPEQKKIAEILSGIDNLIRFLKQQSQKLDAAKAALSKQLISGSSELSKESPYGQIPEHWNESSLGEAIGIENLQTGPFGSQLHAHEYTSDGIPVVMPQDMKDCRVVTSKIARIPPDRAESLEKHRVLSGDILFSRRGDIGRHAVISENESGWICGTGCLRARTHGAINPVFLSELLRHKFALEWLNANAVGQTMLNLNTGILAGLPLVVPPKEVQDKIANSLSSINERSKKIGDQILLTQNLKAAISSDLLSGRKRVSV